MNLNLPPAASALEPPKLSSTPPRVEKEGGKLSSFSGAMLMHIKIQRLDKYVIINHRKT